MQAKRFGNTLIALAGLLAGCNPLLDAGSSEAKPATEETAIGTWRNAAPNPDGRFVRMTLRIDGDHSLLWSRRYSANPSVVDTEYSHEVWGWSVKDGKLLGEKSECSYAAAPDYVLEKADCREPLRVEIPIQVKGNAWVLSEGGEPMVFRKD